MRLKNLSPREAEVLKLLMDGKNNTEIAEILILSTHTVKAHICNILGKFDVENRMQAAIYAKEHPEVFENITPEKTKKPKPEVKPKSETKSTAYSPDYLIRWTKSSIACYQIKSNCSICELVDDIKPHCKMANTVKILEEKLGAPIIPPEIEESYEEYKKTGLCYQGCSYLITRENGFGCQKGSKMLNPNAVKTCNFYKKGEMEMPKKHTELTIAPREMEALRLYIEGKSDIEISEEMNIGEGAPSVYFAQMKKKFKQFNVIDFVPHISDREQIAEYVKKHIFSDIVGQDQKEEQPEIQPEQQNTEIPLEHENIKNRDNVGQFQQLIKNPEIKEQILNIMNVTMPEDKPNCREFLIKLSQKYVSEIDKIAEKIGRAFIYDDEEDTHKIRNLKTTALKIQQKLDLLVEIEKELEAA